MLISDSVKINKTPTFSVNLKVFSDEITVDVITAMVQNSRVNKFSDPFWGHCTVNALGIGRIQIQSNIPTEVSEYILQTNIKTRRNSKRFLQNRFNLF